MGTVRKMAAASLLLAGILAIAGCSSGSENGRPDEAVSTTAPTEPGPTTSGYVQRDQPPYTSGVELGQRYPYQLDTHCGIRWAMIDGRYWETTPLGNSNPPDGWGNPWQNGSIVVESTGSALFEGGGHELHFVPAETEPPDCQ